MDSCSLALDAWCEANCPLDPPLRALLDRSASGDARAWRCYAHHTLTPDLRAYATGNAYCTRHHLLRELSERCRSGQAAQSLPPLPPLPPPSPPPSPPQPHPRQREASLPANPNPNPSPEATCVSSSPTASSPALPPWPGASAGVITIPAVDTSGWMASPSAELVHVHAWSVECIDRYEQHKLKKYTGNVSGRKAFLRREGLACYGVCVRGVVDGFASHAEMAELLSLEPAVDEGRTTGIDTWRWDVPAAPPVFRTLVARAQTVLREQFGVRRLRFYRSNIIQWQGPAGRAGAADPGPAAWSPRSLHGDTNTDEMFLYTTILYLTQHGVDGVGGETGIADEVRERAGRPHETTAGLRVEPSVGRLLVFSAGVENMHEMLPVTRGRRVAVQMWFACDGMDPGWGRPQRLEWQRVHGYGGPDERLSPGAAAARPKAPALSRAQLDARAWPWRARGGEYGADGLD